MNRKLVLPVSLCIVAFAARAEETVVVRVTGVGITVEAAERNAYIAAVREAVGTFVDSQTMVENNDVLFDKILTMSSGYIKDHKTITAARKRKEDDLYETIIEAQVVTSKLRDDLRGANIVTEKLPSDQIQSEAITKITSAQEATRVLDEWLPDALLGLLKAELIDENGQPGAKAIRPQTMPDIKSESVWCAWNISVRYDTGEYYTTIAPRLTEILQAIGHVAAKNLPRSTPSDNSRWSRLAFSGLPVREESRFDSPKRRYDDERNVGILLSSDSRNSMQEQLLDAYVIDKEICLPLILTALAPAALKIRFLASDGQVIRQDELDIHKMLLFSEKACKEYRVPVNADLWDGQHERLICAYWNQELLFIAPEFPVFNDSFSEKTELRYETSFTPQELKQIEKIELSLVRRPVEK